MKEFIEKLIGRLQGREQYYHECALDEIMQNGHTLDAEGFLGKEDAYGDAISITNKLAEEHKGGWIEELLEAKKNCGEDSDCSECPFGQIEDRCILAELQIEGGNNGWIPCSERLPESGIHVLCYGKNSLGSFKYEVSVYAEEIECWMCSKIAEVLAWQPLPEPYKEETT